MISKTTRRTEESRAKEELQRVSRGIITVTFTANGHEVNVSSQNKQDLKSVKDANKNFKIANSQALISQVTSKLPTKKKVVA